MKYLTIYFLKDRLISLDTPTTIQPPQAFCNSPQTLSTSKYYQPPPPPQSQSNAITLDPSTLQQGYANIKMMPNGNGDKSHIEADMSKYNGMVNGVNNNGSSNGMVVCKDKNSNQPFSIQTLQGYSDNFKENHSEISC